MPETSSSTPVSSPGDDRKGVRRLVQTPMSPGRTVDLLKIPKLCFWSERSWKRGLVFYLRQLTHNFRFVRHSRETATVLPWKVPPTASGAFRLRLAH
jgi:hypothetical protein